MNPQNFIARADDEHFEQELHSIASYITPRAYRCLQYGRQASVGPVTPGFLSQNVFDNTYIIDSSIQSQLDRQPASLA